MSSSQVMHNASAINARYGTYPTDMGTPVTGGRIVTQQLERLDGLSHDDSNGVAAYTGNKREMEVHSPDLAVVFANGYAKGMGNETEDETEDDVEDDKEDDAEDDAEEKLLGNERGGEEEEEEEVSKVSVVKPLLKVHEGQMNYIVYSSNGNLQDSTIYGTQINILQSLSAQGESGTTTTTTTTTTTSSSSGSSPSSSIPLPASEYETVSIRVNKAIKEDYKKRKRFQDKGGYYELDDEVCGRDAGVQHSLDGDGVAHEEYALIKAVAFTCGRVLKSKGCAVSGGSPRRSRTSSRHISWNFNGCSY